MVRTLTHAKCARSYLFSANDIQLFQVDNRPTIHWLQHHNCSVISARHSSASIAQVQDPPSQVKQINAMNQVKVLLNWTAVQTRVVNLW